MAKTKKQVKKKHYPNDLVKDLNGFASLSTRAKNVIAQEKCRTIGDLFVLLDNTYTINLGPVTRAELSDLASTVNVSMGELARYYKRQVSHELYQAELTRINLQKEISRLTWSMYVSSKPPAETLQDRIELPIDFQMILRLANADVSNGQIVGVEKPKDGDNSPGAQYMRLYENGIKNIIRYVESVEPPMTEREHEDLEDVDRSG